VAKSKSVWLKLRTVLTGLGLALSALPAASPYLKTGFPRTNDALPHLFRTVALDRVFVTGRIWPRWMPDLVFGLGYPVANFFPALSHIQVELFHLMGMPFTTAYRAVVVLSLVLSGWFMFLLGKEEFGGVAGWVAAIAYVYSPYVLYDAHVRGSLPEEVALAFIPLLFLFLKKAARDGLHWVAATGLAFAAAFLSHPGIGFQSMVIVAVWLVWLGWRGEWRDLWKPVAGLTLGALCTAFFWLPSLLELKYVQGVEAIGAGVIYRDNFLNLGQLFDWPRLTADPALVNPPVVRSLPLIAIGVTVLILLVRWRRLCRDTRWEVAFWLGLLVLCATLTTPLARLAWDVLPLLKLTIFPWRMLGLASLAAAVGLGGMFAGIRADVRTLAVTTGVSVVLLLGAAPWLYPPREFVEESPTIADLMKFEQPPFLVGTTTYAEFLPRWVDVVPTTSSLEESLAQDEDPDRLLAPEGVNVVPVGVSPLESRYQVTTASRATLIYQQFYFPGWRVWLDEAPVDIHPGVRSGLIEFDVPAGEHYLEVKFGSTTARTVGNVLSGIGLVFSVGLLVQGAKGAFASGGSRLLLRPAVPASWILLLTATLLGTKFTLDRVETPFHRSLLNSRAAGLAQHPVVVDFAGELRLLGYDLQPNRYAADDNVSITLYWRALRPIGVIYDRVVQVVDRNALVWSRSDVSRPANWRWAPGTDRWRMDEYVMDPYVLRLLDGTPPGGYAIRVSLVRRDTHQTVAQQIVAQIEVVQPARGDRSLEDGLMPMVSTGEALHGVNLLGAAVDRGEAMPGDPARVTLLWQVTNELAHRDVANVSLGLIAADGKLVWSETYPFAAQYPPPLWHSGDRLRTEIVFRLPARLSDGKYAWQVSVAPDSSWTLGTIRIRNPIRLWKAPSLDIEVDRAVGGVAVMMGANIEPPEQQIRPGTIVSVTLAWRSLATTNVSYRVFLHLSDEKQCVVSQSDGEPANWTRPTTGWLPGEIVLDERVLTLPSDLRPGTYTLSCGLYDMGTGIRLRIPEDGNAVSFGFLTVGAR